MVTWTFDLVALSIGFMVGILVGGLLFAFMEMRDGGAWDKGFFDGCETEALIKYLEHEKERMRDLTKSQKEAKNNENNRNEKDGF